MTLTCEAKRSELDMLNTVMPTVAPLVKQIEETLVSATVKVEAVVRNAAGATDTLSISATITDE